VRSCVSNSDSTASKRTTSGGQPLEPFGEPLGLPAQAREQHGPQRLARAGDELTQVGAGIDEPRHQREHRLRVALRHEAEQLTVHLLGDEPEHLAHPLGGHRPLPERQHLVEDRQAVPHAAVCALGDELDGVVGGGQTFRGEHLLQSGGNGVRPDAPEVKALESREDRRRALRDLLRLGGREHEHDTRRRFFQDLEEGVPRLARQHVRFVDDVHLVTSFRRRGVHGALAQVAGIVHAAVRSRVELDHIQIGGARPDTRARVARAARLAGDPRGIAPLAVQRHRQDARRGRLPHAARPREQIAVRDAARRDRSAQRRSDVGLDNQIGEPLGAVFAG